MQRIKRTVTAALLVSVVLLSVGASPVSARNEFDAVCDHLEDHYGAKKVHIPFMWLARFAVGVMDDVETGVEQCVPAYCTLTIRTTGVIA